MFGQLLAPTLPLSLEQARPLLEGFYAGVISVAKPQVVYLPDIIEGLARLPEEGEIDDDRIEEPELVADEEIPRFDTEQYAALHRLLGDISPEGTRLSQLFAQARQPGVGTGPERDTDLLLALHALGLFAAPSLFGTEADPSRLTAAGDGRELDDPRFAGADLVLARTPGSSADPDPMNELQEARA